MARRRSSPLGRFVRFLVLFVGAVTVALIGAVAWFGPKVSLAFAICHGLTYMGYGPVEVAVTRLDGSGITLENFSAGQDGALALRKARLDFKEGGPLAGAKGLTIDGLVYAAQLSPEGFNSGFALKPTSGSGSFALPKLPFPVVVNDSRGRLNTPFGALDVISQLAAQLDQGALNAAYDLSFAPGGEGAGKIAAHRGTLSIASDAAGAIDLAFSFAPGRMPSGTGASGTPQGSTGAAPTAPAASSTPGLKGGTFVLTAFAKGKPDGGPFEAHAELKDVKLPAFSLSLAHAALDATRAAGATDYAVTLGLDRLDAFKVAFAHAGLEGTLAREGLSYALKIPACARVENVTYGGTATPLHAQFPKLCGALEEDTLLTLKGSDLDVALLVLDATVRDAPAGGRAGFEGTLPQITLTGARGARGWTGALKGEGGDLHAIDAHIVFNDILLEGDFSAPGGSAAAGTFAVNHLLMSDMDKPARFAPITLEGKTALDNGTVTFALLGAMPDIEKLAAFTGSHTLKTGVGEALFDLPKLVFAPGGLQPGQISPTLGGAVTKASGELDAQGKFAWNADGLTSNGAFNIKDLGGDAAFGLIAGMNGNVVFSSLAPLETRETQTLSIKMIEAGLPLPNGTIKFKVQNGGRLVVERAHWPLMGGSIGLSSAVFDLARAENSATLAVDGIDLAQLLVMVDVDGLSGTGTLNGRIPVRFVGAHQYIEGGTLAAQPPGGTLIYKTGVSATASGAPGSGDQSQILFQALENFQYQALDGKIDGDLAGDLSVKVHLKGNNPDLYEGYPVELNVNTDGPFVAMLKKSLFAVHDVAQPQ